MKTSESFFKFTKHSKPKRETDILESRVVGKNSRKQQRQFKRMQGEM